MRRLQVLAIALMFGSPAHGQVSGRFNGVTMPTMTIEGRTCSLFGGFCLPPERLEIVDCCRGEAPFHEAAPDAIQRAGYRLRIYDSDVPQGTPMASMARRVIGPWTVFTWKVCDAVGPNCQYKGGAYRSGVFADPEKLATPGPGAFLARQEVLAFHASISAVNIEALRRAETEIVWIVATIGEQPTTLRLSEFNEAQISDNIP